MSTWSWNIRIRQITPRLILAVGMLVFPAGCGLLPHGAAEISFLGKQQDHQAVDVNRELAEATRLHEAGDFLKAHKIVGRLIQKDPYSLDARLLQAEITRSLGQHTQSARALQAASVLKPNSAEFQNKIGMKLIQLDARQAGLRALTKATELAPHEPRYANDLAGTHFSYGNLQMAKAVLLQAHRQNPRDQILPIALARLFESQENWDRAAHYYTVAIKGNPEDLTWLRQRGRAWYRLKKYEAARIDLAACLDELVANEDWTTLQEYEDICQKTGHTSAAKRAYALRDGNRIDSNPLAKLPSADMPKNVKRRSSSAQNEPVSKPVLLSKNRAIRPRPMRNLTLVRRAGMDRNLQQASFIRTSGGADETPLERKVKKAAITAKSKPSRAAHDGWKPHRRKG